MGTQFDLSSIAVGL